MEKPNIYKKYQISRSLNGERIIFLARYGKQKTLIGIADSEQKLIKMMTSEAARVDDEHKAELRAMEEKEAKRTSKKKVGLWKAGSAFRKKSDESEPETPESNLESSNV